MIADYPTLIQLQIFLQVAKFGSFSQTAQQLGISQPSLSRHVQQLEQCLGVELIDRYHRPLRLTPVGEFYLKQIEPLLAQLDQINQMTQRFASPIANNHLTIGFVASVLYGLLPEIISTLKADLPNLDIKLVEISSDQQLTALKSGEIDVGFSRFRHTDSFIRQIFLRHERFVVALPIAHPLASRQADQGVALAELMEETIILYHRTPLPQQADRLETDPLLSLFEQHRLKPKNTHKVRDIQIALGLVAASEGITIVPDSLKTVRTSQIHYHRLRHENATAPIFMNLLAHQTNPLIQPLLQAIYDVYERKGITYSASML
ncbi:MULTISPECIES: LysR family transcriptional regulator [unclassified Moraxella]|uniref:LysR family transcriptional regulator n=1 Tax=unclassified Moraxella TaxID=2685852 RepID=UPI003AF8488D